MSWTTERIAQLRELWRTGGSASKIAAQMGGFAGTKDGGRSAVIGKVHRLGLEARRATGGKHSNVARQVANKRANGDRNLYHKVTKRIGGKFPKTSNPPIPLPEQFVAQYMVPPQAPENVFEAVLMLRGISGAGQCRMPIGDPCQPGFHFCNLDGVPGKPYCTEHSALAVQPYRPR